MEIKDTLAKKPQFSIKKWLIPVGALLFTGVSLWAFSSVSHHQLVDKSTLRVATVVQQNLQVKVDGYGRLRAKHQRLLTSQTQAIVDSILLYPGAKVTKDTIILTLSNPQLEQEVASARLELARQNAQLKEQVISHKSELLERDAQITLLESDLENAQLRVKAESQLVEQGIVSVLDFKQTQLNVRQLKQRLAIEHKRLAQLREMQQQRLSIANDLVTQYQLNYQTILKQFEQLNVRAGLAGVLQTLPVEIGQSVTPGTQLAMVGSDQQLVAEMRVQQRLADQISIGMAGIVNTFGSEIGAKVTRIDPVVTDGRVIVEMDLIGNFPANARPDLTVEGEIHIKQLSDALVLEQPNEVYGYTTKKLFKVSAQGDSAMLTAIEFGTLSGNKVEVISGVNVGDQVVISDTSQWLSSQSIQLDD